MKGNENMKKIENRNVQVLKLLVGLVIFCAILAIGLITLPKTKKINQVANNENLAAEEQQVTVPSGYTGITNAAEFQKISENLSGKYILMSDINMAGVNFEVIASTGSFTGILDGNYHTISNLNIESSAQNVGIFGTMSSATVKNLTINNVNVKAQNTTASINVGVIAGYATGSSITNIKVIGTNSITNETSSSSVYMGGILGQQRSGYITNTRVDAEIITNNESTYAIYTGGITGYSSYSSSNLAVQITNTYANVQITTNTKGQAYVGGISGQFSGYYNSSTHQYLGKVQLCYSIGRITVNSDGQVAGIVGSASGAQISNTYSVCKIEGADNTQIGGIIAYAGNNVTAGLSYYSKELISDYVNTEIYNSGTQTMTQEMFKKETFVNWDFENTWAIKENEGSMPYLKNIGTEQEVLRENFEFTEYEGNGTEQNPYIIKTVEQFQNLKLCTSAAYFKLGNDLNFENIANFEVIGDTNANYNKRFIGHLDGNNHKISNINIESDAQYVGIFGYINAATIKNLIIENINVNATNTTQALYVGGLVAYAENGVAIDNVRIIGTSSITTENAAALLEMGGIVGDLRNGTMSNCSMTGTIHANVKENNTTAIYMGGIAGNIYRNNVNNITKVENCYANVQIDSNKTYRTNAGGIVGSTGGSNSNNQVEISQVYSTGTIIVKNSTISQAIGGIAGNTSLCKVLNSYSTLNIKGEDNNSSSDIGTAIGYISSASVSNVYSAGKIEGTFASTFIGGMIKGNNGTITNSYWSAEQTGENSNTLSGGTVVLTNKLFKKNTFEGWDFENVWAIKENEGSMPYLRSVGVENDVLKENFEYIEYDGEGTQENPYIIDTTEKFQKMHLFTTEEYFKIVKDLDFSKVENYKPIRDNTAPFIGHLDGNGHTISNINIENTDKEYIGIFGYIKNGSIENLNIKNVNVTTSEMKKRKYQGILAGSIENTTINNVNIIGENTLVTNETTNYSDYVGAITGEQKEGTIENVSVSGTQITALGEIGGIVGYQTGGIIKGSNFDGIINGAGNVGGITGVLNNTKQNAINIEKSYANVKILPSSSSYGGNIGGILGSSTHSATVIANVQEVYSNGTIILNETITQNVGGIVGSAGNTKISNAYSTVNITGNNTSSSTYIGGIAGRTNVAITNTYYAGKIQGEYTTNYVGNILGYNNGYNATMIDNLKSNYWSPEEISSSVKVLNIGTDVFTAALFRAETFKDWDFENIWAIKEDEGSMPYLKNVGWDSDVDTQNYSYLPIDGCGTEEKPYIIDTAEKFNRIRLIKSEAYYEITNDLDFSELTDYAPIGENANLPFKGHIEGNNHKILNLNFESGNKNIGILGYIKDATVKNLQLENIEINSIGTKPTEIGGAAGYNIGILSGYTDGSTIENIKILKNVKVGNKEATDTNTNIGGIVGYAINTTISNIEISDIKVVANTLSSAYIGGVAGNINSTTIDRAKLSNVVVANEENTLQGTTQANYRTIYAGGITAYQSGGKISNSSVSGRVIVNSEAGAFAGGAVGYAAAINASEVLIEHTYSTANVEVNSKSTGNVGGLIGYAYTTGSTATRQSATIAEVYATGNITIANTSSYAGGLIGQMYYMNLRNAYSTGDITIKDGAISPYVGSLIGYIANSSAKPTSTTVTNCYAIGKINCDATNAKIGGVVGLIQITTSKIIYNSYWSPKLTGVEEATNTQETPKTVQELLHQDAYETWDFENVWNIEPNGGSLAYLRNMEVPEDILSSELDYETRVAVKRMSTDKTPLEGGSYVVKNTANQVVREGVSNKKGNFYIKDLEAGTYTVQETEAPAGYMLNDQVFTFKLTEDGKTVDVETNEEIQIEIISDILKIEIQNKELGTNKAVSGSQIGLYNEDGTEALGADGKHIRMTTDYLGKVVLTKVPEGTYKYKQISVKTGYKVNETEYTVTVKPNGEVTFKENNEGIIYSEKIKVNANITVKDIDTEKPIQGVKIALYNESKLAVLNEEGKQVIITTNSNGTAIFENVPVGTYYYKEISVPDEYMMNYSLYKFVVNQNETIFYYTNEGTIYNTVKEAPYKVEHYKQKTDLSGYELVESEEIIGRTGDQVSVNSKQYEGYTLNTYVNGTIIKGKVKSDGSLVLRAYYDKLLQTNFNINISNIDEQNGNAIQGTNYTVSLQYAIGMPLQNMYKTTDENGNINIENILGKNFMYVYIRQTEINEEYFQDKSSRYVQIKVNGEGQVELTGIKSDRIQARVENNTLYITHTNISKDYTNTIRVNAVDNIDKDIKIANVNFEVVYPDGRIKNIRTDEEGIAQIANIKAPGTGTFLYEISQLNTITGYKENKEPIYVNITFNNNGNIVDAIMLSELGKTRLYTLEEALNQNASVITQQDGTTKNLIANINVNQVRDENNPIFSAYNLKIVEQDLETNEKIEGVKYKIIQKRTIGEMSNVITASKITNNEGIITLGVTNGDEVSLTIKRIAAAEGYKLQKEEIEVKLIKNSNGEYVLKEEIEGVSIDNESKTILVNRTLFKTNSSYNEGHQKVNNTIYITKVDEELRPLQGVVLELRELTTGASWELKTDDNGLAKILSEDLVAALGSEFPQKLVTNEGKLTFWITEKTVPVGYERIDEDIGFEAYYETTPEGTLEISYMNVLDGLSYYHIVNQEYSQYEEEEYTQVDIKLKVINKYSSIVDKAKLNTLVIEKVDSKNENKKLANASFEITLTYPTSGKVRAVKTTGSSGAATIGRLYFPEGTTTIQIVEKTAPIGYILENTPKILKVTNNAGTITVEGGQINEAGVITVKIPNEQKEYARPYKIVIQKRDSQTFEKIDYTADFDINITNQSGSKSYERTTKEGVATLTGLNGVGSIQIQIRETDAPIGYKLNNEIKTFYITKPSYEGQIELDTSKTNAENIIISGNTIYVNVYDEREERPEYPMIQIKKVSNSNIMFGLSGAYFKVTMPNDTYKTSATYFSGYANIPIREAVSGRYIIEEISAPNGYIAGKKVAMDITFDENQNITSCNLVTNLGTEYANNIISKNVYGKRLDISIGNEPIEQIKDYSSYKIKIDKVSSLNRDIKLDDALFEIAIKQQNGSNYRLSKETKEERGIYINSLTGTGRIEVSLSELKSPVGYILDGKTKELAFTRNPQTKELVLDVNSLENIEASDIEVNNNTHTITITVEDEPRTYTPVIREDGTPDPYIPEGKKYNSIIIENEDIDNYSIKIEGTTFKTYRKGSYISQGKTNKKGLTTISLGNTEYYTTEQYVIQNYEMENGWYIRNRDVELEITYNSEGKMVSAQFISGHIDAKNRIVAEVDDSVDYVGKNIIKVKIRCEKRTYTPITSTTEEPKETISGGKPITILPEEKPSPIIGTVHENEPDFGIQIEKVNIYNSRIKVANAKYAIYILNEDTNESISIIQNTDASGKIFISGLLGYGNFKITAVEISSPEGYALDEHRQEIRISRNEESEMITILDDDLGSNATARVDNMNKIVKMTIEETPSTVGFGLLKQDYQDEEIALKNSKFEITDLETNDVHEITTGEEGMAYSSLPIKEDGQHRFKVKETQAPGGYSILTNEVILKVNYINGLIASATVEGSDDYAYVTTQNEQYVEINILNGKIPEGIKYDVELIKADAYYSSITFENAKIKIDIDHEKGLQGLTKTALTNESGKIAINNIYGTGKAYIKITEIEPPPGRRFDLKEKQVVLNINEETGWIKLDQETRNVDVFVDNDNKKVTIRIRNYPDGTFVIGANKVDSLDNSLMLYGARYSVQLEGSSKTYQTVQYSDGLLALQDIPMPSPTASGIYTYIIKEVEAPFGYTLDTTPTVLKVEVSKVKGINKITNAYVESGNGEVQKFGDEYVHLKFKDTLQDIGGEVSDPYTIIINKVDSLNHRYVIKGAIIGVSVHAESGESYYKEMETDENGQIILSRINGTGKITVKLEELHAATNYKIASSVRTVTFERDPETKAITIDEIEQKGVEAVEKDGNVEITLENEIDTGKATIIQTTKVWQDNEKQQERRPENIKLQVKRDGEVVQEYTISNKEDGITFTNLPKYDEEGNEIVYEIVEAEENSGDLKFYVSSIEGNTITNTFTVPTDKIELEVHKIWVDNELQALRRPEKIKIQIKHNGEIVQEKEILSTDEKVTFTDLPKYNSDGEEIIYEIAEAEVNNGDLKFYVSSIDEETNTITNTFTVPEEKTSIPVTKIWVDNSNSALKRPEGVIIVAKRGEAQVGQVLLTEANAQEENGNIWEGQIGNLQKYDTNGNEIQYEIAEKEVNEGDLKFYIQQINQETKTVTNTFTVPEEKTSIDVTKIWEDNSNSALKRPEGIIIVAKSGGIEKGQVILTVANALEENNNIWKGQIENLPKYDANGDLVEYEIDEKEVNVGDLKFYVKNINQETRTITNTFTVPDEKTSIDVTKIWEDNNNSALKRPEGVIIVAKSEDGIEKGQVQLTVADALEENNNIWKGQIENLPKYDENANVIEYEIDEKEVNEGDLKFYTKTIDQETKTVTNTFSIPTEKTSIDVTKIWEDNSNKALKRPESVIIVAKSEGVEKGQVILTVANALEENNNIWKGQIENLLKYDANGDKIEYEIDEKEVNAGDLKFYVKTINEETRTITNTFTVPEEKTSIDVTKVWEDNNNSALKRPEGVIIVAKSEDGIEKGQVQLTVANALEENNNIWKGQIGNLQKYDANGNEIIYEIDEKEVNVGDLKFYVKTIDQETRTVTNTFTVPDEKTSIDVTKIWEDNNNSALKRPESVIIVAKSEGIEKGQVILTVANALEENNNIWKGQIKNLPKYDANGDIAEYEIDEKEVNVGDLKFYVKTIDQETRTITNTFKVPEEKTSIVVTKIWEDDSNRALKRPESIIIVAKSEDGIEKDQVILTVANALNGDNNIWQGQIQNLLKYDENGNEIVYEIDEKEVNVGDLKFYVKTINQETRTVTNTFTVPEEKIGMMVTKIWIDNNNKELKRPEGVIIVAKRGEEEIGQVLLTEENAIIGNKNIWQGQIENLPKYDENANEIIYEIDEKEVTPGDLYFYKKTIEGTTVINTLQYEKAKYKVEHYRRNLDQELEGYECEVEYFEEFPGTFVTAVPKQYEGFTENTTHPNRIPSGTVTSDGMLVLRLYYDRISYNITYELNKGTATRTLPKTYTYGREMYLSRKVERKGYQFVGWYDNPNFEGEPITKIGIGETGDKTFYAKWSGSVISSEKYKINEQKKYITQVSPETKVQDFLANIEIDGEAKVYDHQGNEVQPDKIVGTGYKVIIETEGVTYEYQIAVRGDLDGNGKISITDLSMLNQRAVGDKKLSDIQEAAADIDGNGKISITDISMLNQHIVKSITL